MIQESKFQTPELSLGLSSRTMTNAMMFGSVHIIKFLWHVLCIELHCIAFYYIDTSVSLENTPLVKFVENYIWDPGGLISISSLVRMMMSYPAFSQLFVQTVSKNGK